MTDLTETEREALADAAEDLICRAHGVISSYDYGTDEPFVAVVASIVATRLANAAERLLEFDASDDYHRDDYDDPGYYAALNRAVSLLRGEITTWTDPPAALSPARPAHNEVQED